MQTEVYHVTNLLLCAAQEQIDQQVKGAAGGSHLESTQGDVSRGKKASPLQGNFGECIPLLFISVLSKL